MNLILDHYLKQPGQTSSGLARQVGVRNATVSAWRRGVTPNRENMIKIQLVTGGKVPIDSWFHHEKPVQSFDHALAPDAAQGNEVAQ